MNKIKQFVFRFEEVSQDIEINDTNVYQYEFRNIGQSVVEINGARLRPPQPSSEWHVLQLFVYNDEKDVTIYKVKFIREPGECVAVIALPIPVCNIP